MQRPIIIILGVGILAAIAIGFLSYSFDSGLMMLAVLLAISIALLSWFVVNVTGLYRSGALRPSRGIHRRMLTPAAIQNWMTFSYINRAFNLPPDYLSVTLMIQDARYPNLGVGTYAKTKNLNEADFLQQVQGAVTGYLQGTVK